MAEYFALFTIHVSMIPHIVQTTDKSHVSLSKNVNKMQFIRGTLDKRIKK